MALSTFKSIVERNLEAYYNTNNYPKKLFKFYQAYFFSALCLNKDVQKYAEYVNSTFYDYYYSLIHKQDTTDYEAQFERMIFNDFNVINQFLSTFKDTDNEIESEDSYIIQYIEGSIATEHKSKDYVFKVNMPPHAHAEENYDFMKIYKKEFGLKSYKELYKKMLKYRKDTEETFKNKVIKTDKVKETKPVKDNTLGKNAYELKKSNNDISWLEIAKSVSSSVHTAQNKALEYALSVGDNVFVQKYLPKKRSGNEEKV